ncbi:NucA/NucB deoxyribonuclease domain-containing protein [Streptomyces hundungensis]|nr:hypothetical protein [Streptomyces hundungensis]
MAALAFIVGIIFAPYAGASPVQPGAWTQRYTSYTPLEVPEIGSSAYAWQRKAATIVPAQGARPRTLATDAQVAEEQRRLGEHVIFDPEAPEVKASTRAMDDGDADLEACKTTPGAADPGGKYGDSWNWCHRIFGTAVWGEGEKIVGTVTWTTVSTATTNNGTRSFKVKTKPYDIKPKGKYTGKSHLSSYLRVDSGEIPCTINDSQNPATLTLDEWEVPRAYGIYTVTCPTGGHELVDDRQMANFSIAQIVPDGPLATWGWLFYNVARTDSASYLSTKQGSSFPLVAMVIAQRTTGTSYNGVSQHIKEFYQQNPQGDGNYYDLVARPDAAFPLMRNYAKWGDDESAQVERDNTNAKNRECAALPPHQPDEQCDEYPFNSTINGGGSGKAFSVKYINGTENSKGGFFLADAYSKLRILHLDSFWVKAD